MAAAGPGDRGATATVRGQKTRLSRRARELRAATAVQEQGRQFFTQSCEKKLRGNRERLPRLCEAVQEDAQALAMARKHKPVLAPEVLRAHNLPPDLAGLTVEEAREKLRATIYKQANTLNMLDYQLRQRCQTRDKLQQQLLRLQEEESDETKKQKRMIRQLENDLDKRRAKLRAAEKVGTVYERVYDALQKEVSQLTREAVRMWRQSELDDMELKDMEARAEEARKAAEIAQEELAKREAEFLAERSLDTQKVPMERLWLRELSEKKVPAAVKSESSVDVSTQQDPLVGHPQQDPGTGVILGGPGEVHQGAGRAAGGAGEKTEGSGAEEGFAHVSPGPQQNQDAGEGAEGETAGARGRAGPVASPDAEERGAPL